MPRPRDPNRDRAFEIYQQSDGTIDLVEITSQLNLPPGTVRGWKSKDDWDLKMNGAFHKNTERSEKSMECSKRMKGGQPGNRNAVGHGDTGPLGNKNAVTTGEFEALLFDCLTQDEKRLVQAVPNDKELLLLREIKLLTIRERRMLKRIDDLKRTAADQDKKKAEGMTAVKWKDGCGANGPVDITEYEGVPGQILSVEDA